MATQRRQIIAGRSGADAGVIPGVRSFNGATVCEVENVRASTLHNALHGLIADFFLGLFFYFVHIQQHFMSFRLLTLCAKETISSALISEAFPLRHLDGIFHPQVLSRLEP